MAEHADGAQAQGDNPLEAAVRRLDRALALLEGRIEELSGRAEGASGGLFDFDRSNLAAELDQARAREHALEAAGAEASQALGEAIEGIRRVLGRTEAV